MVVVAGKRVVDFLLLMLKMLLLPLATNELVSLVCALVRAVVLGVSTSGRPVALCVKIEGVLPTSATVDGGK